VDERRFLFGAIDHPPRAFCQLSMLGYAVVFARFQMAATYLVPY
jgi:hypothetical protein